MWGAWLGGMTRKVSAQSALLLFLVSANTYIWPFPKRGIHVSSVPESPFKPLCPIKCVSDNVFLSS